MKAPQRFDTARLTLVSANESDSAEVFHHGVRWPARLKLN
jgi:hypothetical protein